ncbi:amino acid ABC transporter substrate-binding protein [Aliikangiella marina]|uniref:Amino acid ABC transporter substrate-binding protein n=1 Tax=Aliikangiella marina TaxID=1712262 RepID=A0A545TEA1_9GAMM|nr:transporter substrate-binding domain-containing protein [Aliikangiella marina]TQV75547.1 amino acid ABC transporter substrate-binding protein [Aliikangiella marina]
MRLQKSNLLVLIIISISSIAKANAQAVTRDSIQADSNSQHCELVYGWAEWPPLQYFKTNREIAGIQTEMVRTLAEDLNCNITFFKSDWSNIVELIKIGEVDFTANATPTETRKQFALFSDVYRKDSYGIWVKAESFAQYKNMSIDELKRSGFKLGMTRSHFYSEALDNWQHDKEYSKNIIYGDSSAISMQRLIEGQVNGCVEDPLIVGYKKRIKVITADIARLPINIFGHDVALMFSKKSVSPETVIKFNEALARLKKSGKYNSIWLDPKYQSED